MVEFALVIPLLLTIVYGLLEVGRLLFIYSSVVTASRQAARYGVVTGVNENGIPRYQDCLGIRTAAKQVGFIQEIKDSDIDIQFDTGPGTATFASCNGVDFLALQPHNGDRVNVSVATDYMPIIPILPLDPFQIESSSSRTILVDIEIEMTAAPLGWDPNVTATATNTPTATATPTATLLPIYIFFIDPDLDNKYIFNAEDTRFETYASNPLYGNGNGDGISHVHFWFSGPSAIPEKFEYSMEYCAFGGNNPCKTVDNVVDFSSLSEGTYTMFAQAYGVDGRISATITRSFVIPAATPTTTFTPTASPTPTLTFTPTPTPLPSPVYIEITEPTDGKVITSADQTLFEAIAWDPDVGTTNGDGISHVHFWFSGPSTIPGKFEYWVKYCAFGNGSPTCRDIDAVVPLSSLANGTYTMYAQAYDQDGNWSSADSVTFDVQLPPPTFTPTPLVCSLGHSSLTQTGQRQLSMTIDNNSDFPVTYDQITLYYNAGSHKQQALKKIYSEGTLIWDGSKSGSPVMISTFLLNDTIAGNSSETLVFEFNKNLSINGSERVLVTFSESGCPVVDSSN